MAFDYIMFYNAIQMMQVGYSPYQFLGFISPFPFALFFYPFGLLPFWIGFGLFTLLNLSILVYITKWNVFKVILFSPITFCLWVGNIDIIVVGLAFTNTWWGVALSSLKPQLAIWIIPYYFYTWFKNREWQKLQLSCASILLIYSIPTIFNPDWIGEWRSVTPSILHYATHASSIFGSISFLPDNIVAQSILFVTIALLTLPMMLYSNKTNYWNIMAMFNPVSNLYSLSILMNKVDFTSILMSWALIPFALYLHTGLPFVFIPIYFSLKEYYNDGLYFKTNGRKEIQVY